MLAAAAAAAAAIISLLWVISWVTWVVCVWPSAGGSLVSPSSMGGLDSWHEVEDGVTAAIGSWWWSGGCCYMVVEGSILSAAALPFGVGGRFMTARSIKLMTAVSLRALIELLWSQAAWH